VKIIQILLTILFILVFVKSVYAQEITEKQALLIAEGVFNETVPDNVKNEYIFLSISTPGYDHSLYRVAWVRDINNVRVMGDSLVVHIKKDTGDVYDKDFSYGLPATQLNTNPKLNGDQARYIIEKAYGEVEELRLGIVNGKLQYSADIKGGGTVVIDANSGRTITVVALQQVSTKFEPSKYYWDTFGVYAVIAAIILVCLFVLFISKKSKFKLQGLYL
jgi:uncharacterized membrane protein YkoI